jgi:hypothetical protein
MKKKKNKKKEKKKHYIQEFKFLHREWVHVALRTRTKGRVFITETECVYCAVLTEPINVRRN